MTQTFSRLNGSKSGSNISYLEKNDNRLEVDFLREQNVASLEEVNANLRQLIKARDEIILMLRRGMK